MAAKRSLLLILLAYIAFISLGLPDGLLGVAWPSMRSDFNLPLDALGTLLVGATCGYMLSSFVSGAVSRRLGIGRLLAVSCATTALALIGYALAPYWWLLIGLALLLGLGAGAIDAGLNNYVATHHSDRMMQWLHASFGVGVTLGPLIMTAGLKLTGNWHPGYWAVGLAQLGLALVFFVTAPLWLNRSDDHPPEPAAQLSDEAGKVSTTRPDLLQPASLFKSLRTLSVWLSMLLFFCYTGLELTMGLWTYSLLAEARGFSVATAGLWVSIYWGMFTLGRLLAGAFANWLGHQRLIWGSLALALMGAILLIWNPANAVGLFAIGLIGFAFAPVFPGLVSGTLHRVGKAHQDNSMGMQIAAAGIGGAGLPALSGVLAARYSLEIVPWALLVALLLLTGFYWLSLSRFSRHHG